MTPTVTPEVLRRQATERYIAELSAIEQAETAAQAAQAALEQLDQAKQAEQQAQARKEAATIDFERIAAEYAGKVAAIADEVDVWRGAVERSAALVLQARQQGQAYKDRVLAVLQGFAAECKPLAADIPPAELGQLVADAALQMADLDLAPKVNRPALANLQANVGWRNAMSKTGDDRENAVWQGLR